MVLNILDYKMSFEVVIKLLTTKIYHIFSIEISKRIKNLSKWYMHNTYPFETKLCCTYLENINLAKK